jgi:CoA:oxalate CoA-transferase
MQPLAGIRVVDLTHAVAGSFCTYHLGLMGADILKIEPPGHGDEFRAFRASTFAAANAGKRSMTLDLKSPRGREILHQLIRDADVVTENFRPGVNVKLGLDWDRLKEINPRLIYCSISGFGQDGPFRDYPAIEWSVQAVSGITDTYIDPKGDPRRLGIAQLDPFAGYMGFSSIMAAILQRQKTGVGQRIDVGMLDAGWVLNSLSVTDMLMGMRPVSDTLRASAQRFMAQDKPLFIAVLWPKWFASLCEVIGAPELKDDPRFREERERNQHSDAFRLEVEARLRTRPAVEWEKALVARGVPAGMVRTMPDVADAMDLEARGLLHKVRLLEDDREIRIVGPGFRFEHDNPQLQSGVPPLGAATETELRRLGYSDAEIDELKSAAIV